MRTSTPTWAQGNILSSSYKGELKKAMELLDSYPRVIFLGQSIVYGGSIISPSMEGITNKLELPVMEDTQMGMSIGLSLMGYIPVSIYPRFDFLLLATNQLVNHLDKIEEMSHGEYKTKVIIRVCVGATTPLYPGLQHCGDYTEAYKLLLNTIPVVRLEQPEQIVPEYQEALDRASSTILVELGDLYD